MNNVTYQDLCNSLQKTAVEAGQKIMEIKEGKMGVTYKDDMSPVTLADQAAEDIILRALRKISPQIPIVAEESVSAGIIPEVQEKFWLVDPLDGTKEFISGGNDFTVNIALIENGAPTFGIIYAPALGHLYSTVEKSVATRQNVKNGNTIEDEIIISVRKASNNNLTALASKSHLDNQTKEFLDKLNVTNTVCAGSSLKFCVVAEGNADIYPRFGPTMEWDTAAGHAILNAAGGKVINPDGTDFSYCKPFYKNGAFIATGDIKL